MTNMICYYLQNNILKNEIIYEGNTQEKESGGMSEYDETGEFKEAF